MENDDNDSHGAWQQQQEEFRRMAEEERAENPLWDKCLTHPERQRDGSEPYCAECRENHRRNYADGASARGRTYEYDGPEILGYDGHTYREMRLK